MFYSLKPVTSFSSQYPQEHTGGQKLQRERIELPTYDGSSILSLRKLSRQMSAIFFYSLCSFCRSRFGLVQQAWSKAAMRSKKPERPCYSQLGGLDFAKSLGGFRLSFVVLGKMLPNERQRVIAYTVLILVLSDFHSIPAQICNCLKPNKINLLRIISRFLSVDAGLVRWSLAGLPIADKMQYLHCRQKIKLFNAPPQN